MSWLYQPQITIGTTIIPDAEEMRHLKALRFRSGDEIVVTNGNGSVFYCEIQGERQDQNILVKREEIFTPKSPTLHMVIAPTKNTDRLEWFIEKTVEIGVNDIHLVMCENSERPSIRMDRLDRLAIAAMKQSHQCWLPKIHEMIPFHEFAKHSFDGQKFIAHCYNDTEKTPLKNALTPKMDTMICIGPEGDFSRDEVYLAEQNGFTAVSLGNSRLRTETAGIVAVHTFQLIHQN